MRYLRGVLAWSVQSLLHRRLRSGLSVLEIGMAMALLVGVMGFYRGYRSALAHNIDRLGYQILVTAKGCPYEAATLVLRGGVIPMYMEALLAEEIAARPEVAAITRFLMQAEPGEEEGHRMQMFLGVDDEFLRMKPWLEFQRGGWFTSPAADEMILGYNVAQEWRADIGDVLTLRRREFRVQGVLDRSGTQDDGTVLVPLGVAQRAFDRMGKVTGVGVRLRDLDHLDAFADEMYDLPSTQVITMSQVQGTILDLVRTARWLMSAVALIGLVIAAVGITNTVLMAVLERLPDLGILRALGGGRGDIFLLVWSEGLLLALAGIAAGTGIAFLTAGGCEALLRRILPYSPVGTLVRITPGGLLEAGGAILVLGLVGGVYPALRAVRVPPLRSIREAY
ncbi:MAG: ABC transporter permease [Acidobacteria bacterium]|nr:ABC transporter permease [Acidobacteriota bacterium]